MADIINGWTISKTHYNGAEMWQAVKNGIIGFQHPLKHHVTRWAADNKSPIDKK